MTIQEYLQTAGLVLASGNQQKLTEFKRILLPRGIELIGANELGLDLDVPETEPTFRGNAALKARAYFQHAQRPVIADGAPGVYSARYGGHGLDDAGRRRFLLSELERVGATGNNRTARFVCVLALYLPDGDLYYFEGVCEGSIADTERVRAVSATIRFFWIRTPVDRLRNCRRRKRTRAVIAVARWPLCSTVSPPRCPENQFSRLRRLSPNRSMPGASICT